MLSTSGKWWWWCSCMFLQLLSNNFGSFWFSCFGFGVVFSGIFWCSLNLVLDFLTVIFAQFGQFSSGHWTVILHLVHETSLHHTKLAFAKDLRKDTTANGRRGSLYPQQMLFSDQSSNGFCLSSMLPIGTHYGYGYSTEAQGSFRMLLDTKYLVYLGVVFLAILSFGPTKSPLKDYFLCVIGFLSANPSIVFTNFMFFHEKACSFKVALYIAEPLWTSCSFMFSSPILVKMSRLWHPWSHHRVENRPPIGWGVGVAEAKL